MTVIHTKTNYQVQFAWLVIGEYITLDEARAFCVWYPHGERIEIRDNDIMIENISKVG